MKLTDFYYDLPEELIAQFPPETRGDSRLLKVLNGQGLKDAEFASIVDEIRAGDLLVLNNTKVIPARVFASKETGGKVEIMLERIIDENTLLAQVRASKAPKVGQQLFVSEDSTACLTVLGREGTFFKLGTQNIDNLFAWFERVGHMPLPPYIDRSDKELDQDRYQTVYAEQQGAVAAPTAGLHYTDELLAKITEKGAEIAHLTLHVGAGTYQPVRVDDISEHRMHSEYIDVSSELCDKIHACKAQGGRVIAVGTTVVRSLEAAAQAAKQGIIQPYLGDTDIFIYPGYQFKVVDLLQTNFHLPESTLLMMVSAFAGYERIMAAYKHAVAQKYRFFSYGDAMLLERSN